MRRAPLFVLVVLAMVLFFLASACYTVSETEQVIITQFGKPVGEPITEPGLHFKMPFIQTVNRLEKRVLEWDGAPVGCRPRTRPTSTSTPSRDGGSTTRCNTSCACATSAAPSRASRTSSAARRATPSPSTS